MKTIQSKFAMPRLAALAAVLATGGALVPVTASALTASNTTIQNTVTVSYADNSAIPVPQPSVSATVDVTVRLISTTPTLALDDTSPKTIAPSSTATYNFLLTSSANGPDTYLVTRTATTDTNLAGNGLDVDPAAVSGLSAPDTASSISLGATSVAVATTLAASATTTVTVPRDNTVGDSAVNGLSVGDTVVIGLANNVFTVAAIDDQNGVGTTTIDLTNATATAVNVAVGDLIRERKSFTVTVDPSALEPTFTTGSVTVEVTAQDTVGSTAGDTPADAAASAPVAIVTNVEQLLAVTKFVRNLTTGDAGSGTSVTPAAGGDTYYSAGVVATPGQRLEYLVRIQNLSTSNAATNVIIDDPVPQFTTFREDDGGLAGDCSSSFAVGAGAEGSAVFTTVTTAADDAGEVAGGSVRLYPGVGGNDSPDAGGTVAANSYVWGRFCVSVD